MVCLPATAQLPRELQNRYLPGILSLMLVKGFTS